VRQTLLLFFFPELLGLIGAQAHTPVPQATIRQPTPSKFRTGLTNQQQIQTGTVSQCPDPPVVTTLTLQDAVAWANWSMSTRNQSQVTTSNLTNQNKDRVTELRPEILGLIGAQAVHLRQTISQPTCQQI
jgi:hypothetical protein